MSVSWGAHGSFHGNTISDGSHRPATVVMHLRVRNLAQTWRWPERDFPFSIACLLSLNILGLLFILSISPYPPDISLLTLYECICLSLLSLSLFSHSSHLPVAFLPPHAWFSLPVALQRKFNMDCLEFPRIPFGVAPGTTQRQTSAVAAKSSKHASLSCSFLLHWSRLMLSSKWFVLPVKSAPQDVSSPVKIRKCRRVYKHFRESCYGVIWNFWHSKYSMGTLLSLCSRCSSCFFPGRSVGHEI